MTKPTYIYIYTIYIYMVYIYIYIYIFDQIIATSHDLGPQKVAFSKGNPLVEVTSSPSWTKQKASGRNAK